MDNYRVLPIISPPISAFSHQVFPLSILMSYEESLPWVFSNYIQLFTLKDLYNQGERVGTGDFFYNYYGDWQLFEIKTCPWLQYYEVPQNFIFSNMNIHDFLKKFLNLGFYVKICVDKYFIKFYKIGELHETHQLMVYGYDDLNQEYFVADNFAFGKFKFLKISYTDLYDSVNIIIKNDIRSDTLRAIDLIKFKKCDNLFPEMFKLNTAKIINDIKEYLLIDGYGEIYRKISVNYIFGINYYDSLIKYYEKCSKLIEQIDNRTISVLFDHKNLMYSRLIYMSEHNNLINGEFFIESYKEIKTSILIARNLLVKYNITKNSSNVNRIISLLEEVKKNEIYILNVLIKNINANNELK